MFRKGEKIVCIDNIDYTELLDLYSIYEIESIIIVDRNPSILLNGATGLWSSDRFISLIEFRKKKILNLKNGIKNRKQN